MKHKTTEPLPRLRAHELSSVRGGRTLFEHVSFEVHAGELWQITGANGAGKSTLLRMLAGLMPSSSGRIEFNNQPIQYDRSVYHQQLLFIGHKPAVKAELTALENVYWQRRLSGDKTAQQDSSSDWDLLETIGLLGLEDEVTGRLSAGQQRRVALTRLWHSQAPLWILDEPFTALDVKGIALLQQRFQTHLGQGGSIVMTSHQALSLASLNPKQRHLGETYANAMGAPS